MAESTIGVPPDSTGKKLRTSQQSISGVAVEEQYMRLAHAGGPDNVSFVGTATNRAVQEWTSLQSFVIPAGYYAQPIAFRALSATAGYGARAIYMRKLGSINMATGAFTDGGVAAPGNYFSGLMAVAPAGIGAASAVTITFTDDQGVTGRQAVASFPLNAPAGTKMDSAIAVAANGMTYPARTDPFGRATTPVAGVFDVTNVTRSVASTNTIDIYGYDVLAKVRTVAANTMYSEPLNPMLLGIKAGDILSVESNSYATAVAAILQERQLLFQLTAI